MPTAKMTARWVETIAPPPEGRLDYFDKKQSGLTLRVSQTGKKVWGVIYRVRGQSRKHRLTLEHFPAMSLSEARDQAQAVTLEASRGNDPATQKQMDKVAPTFAFLAAEYLTRHAAQKKSRKEDERIINRELLPKWGDFKVTTIKRRDVIALLDEIKDRPAPIMANRTLALIRKMFNFAIERDLAETNPCLQVRAPGKEKSRDRVLSESEIRAFWSTLHHTEMAEGTRQALRMILVTAQRPGEVVASEWKEFDLETGWWTIPEEKAKNGLAHRVPLNAIAMGILKQISQRDGYLFPSPWGSGHVERTSLAHAVRKNRTVFEIEPFTPHDLRRTAASHMAGSGVPRLIIAKLLNHVESGVTAIYDRHSYDGQKKEAMEGWGRSLAQLMSGLKAV